MYCINSYPEIWSDVFSAKLPPCANFTLVYSSREAWGTSSVVDWLMSQDGGAILLGITGIQHVASQHSSWGAVGQFSSWANFSQVFGFYCSRGLVSCVCREGEPTCHTFVCEIPKLTHVNSILLYSIQFKILFWLSKYIAL